MKKSLLLLGVLLVLPFLAGAQNQGKIPIEVMSCRELLCTNRTDIFLVNESAYLDYNSSVKGISYSGMLTFPDGSRQQIMFPNRVTSNVTGNYTVEITAWKDGYGETSVSKTIRFVDKLPETPVQNPPRADWISAAFAIALVTLIFATWKYYARKGKPLGKHKVEKPETEKEKTREH